MSHLILKEDYDFARRYPEDTAQIVQALARAGYDITPATAAEAWHRCSQRRTGMEWTIPPDNNYAYIVKCILKETQRA